MAHTVLRVTAVYLCVIVIAASIAYLADHLGRHIGRRKMSILHLRPRHTSILITTCSGAAIAVITLTIFAFLSNPVRTLLTGVEELRKEESALRVKVENLRQELEHGVFVWNSNEPIVHMTMPSGLAPDRTRDAVNSLLAEANSKTILRNNDIARARGDEPLPADEIIVDFDPKMVDEITDKMSYGMGVMGLRVLAKQNCLYKERAPIAVEVWEVAMVFYKGEIVARQTMSMDEQLSDFFKFVETMRVKAIKKGMRPVGGELGGGLDSEEFDALQLKMRQQSGPFELVAVANRDLYETSSLDVSIEVRPLNGEEGIADTADSYATEPAETEADQGEKVPGDGSLSGQSVENNGQADNEVFW